MNGKIIIGGVVVLICLIGGILLWQKIPKQPAQELKLSDFPEKFKEKTAIVLGDNASEIERQAAEEIKNFLVENGSTDIKITDSQNIENFKKGYDLVIIGTPKTNPFLEEVYALTNATRVTEEYPGEGKGVLEILPSPWDESKAMLLVEGSDEWGVKAGGEIIEQTQELNEANIVVEWKESGAAIVEEPPLGEVMSAGKYYSSEPFKVEEYDVSKVIERAKETNHWIRYGSVGGPYTYHNGSESKKLYAYKEGYISITRREGEYWFTIGPANHDNPANYELIAMFVPHENIEVDTACEIVKNELMELGISLSHGEKIEWDLSKGFIPPKLPKQGGSP
ncbi:MAG: hypothetical protein OCU22_09200 [Canidatus Methanoxibalbensis ujae]|nr:hypothetical protein [Candidatus Methanoxibalbensis ujae]